MTIKNVQLYLDSMHNNNYYSVESILKIKKSS